jgi:hypothetical protein
VSIYQKVKVACAEVGISVYALEMEVGLPRSSICKWDKSIPAVDKVGKVAKRLKKPIEYFLEDTTTSVPQNGQ